VAGRKGCEVDVAKEEISMNEWILNSVDGISVAVDDNGLRIVGDRLEVFTRLEVVVSWCGEFKYERFR